MTTPQWSDKVRTEDGEEGRVVELDEQGFALVSLDTQQREVTRQGRPAGFTNVSRWYPLNELKTI